METISPIRNGALPLSSRCLTPSRAMLYICHSAQNTNIELRTFHRRREHTYRFVVFSPNKPDPPGSKYEVFLTRSYFIWPGYIRVRRGRALLARGGDQIPKTASLDPEDHPPEFKVSLAVNAPVKTSCAADSERGLGGVKAWLTLNPEPNAKA